MERVALTGAHGFLGWHVRAALRALFPTARVSVIPLGDGFDGEAALGAIDGVDRLIHIAGVNRGTDDEVRDGNLLFAAQVAGVLRRTTRPPRSVVFANSTQSAGDSVYGLAKAEAAARLRTAASACGSEFHDVLLPNLFGEHGQPFYNSVVATFCHRAASGEDLVVQNDKVLDLLHAQDAADALLDPRPAAVIATTPLLVSALADRIRSFAGLYAGGDVPGIADPFDRDLFNTYRSFAFARRPVIALRTNADQRGGFVEVVRSHGGGGQSSFSTTVSGVSRGDHFHRRKVERFTVIRGEAVIAMRRLFSRDVLEFRVSGSEPVSLDMPTLWSHKITNVGDEELLTSFWSNEVFDPEHPDTIAEAVAA